MQSTVYAAFPGVGKTYCAGRKGTDVCDIDSRQFPKDLFPDNYIDFIKQKLGTARVLLVTCHKEVLDALLKEGIPFTLVYPHKELKEEYLQRFMRREDADSFIQSLGAKWEQLIAELEQRTDVPRIVLKSGQYLSDVLGVNNT
jgi:hypothetical protein